MPDLFWNETEQEIEQEWNITKVMLFGFISLTLKMKEVKFIDLEN